MPHFLKSYMNPCRTVIARRRLLLKPSSMYAFQSLYDDSWLEFLGPRRKQAVCMFQKASCVLPLTDKIVCRITYSVVSTNACHCLEFKSQEDRRWRNQDGNHRMLGGREEGEACSDVYGVLAPSRWVVLNNLKGLESHTF